MEKIVIKNYYLEIITSYAMYMDSNIIVSHHCQNKKQIQIYMIMLSAVNNVKIILSDHIS